MCVQYQSGEGTHAGTGPGPGQCLRARPTQPQRPGHGTAVRQPGNGDPDQVAPDDRRLLEACEPAAAEQLRVQPAPAHDADLAVFLVVQFGFLIGGCPRWPGPCTRTGRCRGCGAGPPCPGRAAAGPGRTPGHCAAGPAPAPGDRGRRRSPAPRRTRRPSHTAGPASPRPRPAARHGPAAARRPPARHRPRHPPGPGPAARSANPGRRTAGPATGTPGRPPPPRRRQHRIGQLGQRIAATSTRTAGYTGSDSKPPGIAPNAQLWLLRKPKGLL
jgi:hypothetical protein